jgi:predicted transposase YdaD
MLKIQEELGLKNTAFYKETFEEDREKGRLATVPLLRELGLRDEVIAEKLQLPLALAQGIPKPQSNDESV